MPTEPAFASTADTRQVRGRSRAIRLATVTLLSVLLVALAPLPAEAQNPGCGSTDMVSVELLGFPAELTDADVRIATDAEGVTVVATKGDLFGDYDYRALTVRTPNSGYSTIGAVTSNGRLIGWGWAPGHSLSYDGCTASSTDALTLIVFWGRPQLDLTSLAATDAV